MRESEYLIFLDMITVARIKNDIMDVIVRLQDELVRKEEVADQLFQVVKEMADFEQEFIYQIRQQNERTSRAAGHSSRGEDR